jgi:hypothetical protein
MEFTSTKDNVIVLMSHKVIILLIMKKKQIANVIKEPLAHTKLL